MRERGRFCSCSTFDPWLLIGKQGVIIQWVNQYMYWTHKVTGYEVCDDFVITRKLLTVDVHLDSSYNLMCDRRQITWILTFEMDVNQVSLQWVQCHLGAPERAWALSGVLIFILFKWRSWTGLSFKFPSAQKLPSIIKCQLTQCTWRLLNYKQFIKT